MVCVLKRFKYFHVDSTIEKDAIEAAAIAKEEQQQQQRVNGNHLFYFKIYVFIFF